MPDRARERVLQAAISCFSRQGFAETSISDICRAAGVVPATLYRHYPSKEALFEAAGRPGPAGGAAPFRRREMLEAALDLFSRQGYEATAMAQVAAMAGVSRAAIYAQFPSKEALLTAVLREQPALEAAERLSRPETPTAGPGEAAGPAASGPEPPAPGRGGPPDPLRDLEAMARQFLLLYQDPRRVALLRLIMQEGNRFPEFRQAFGRMVDSGSGALSRYLSAVAPDLPDPQFTARMFLGGLISFVLTQQAVPVTQDVYAPDDIARMAARQLVEGLQTRRNEP